MYILFSILKISYFPHCFSYKCCSGSRAEADEFIEIGALNGIFVLGRSMGFIGESHFNLATSSTIRARQDLLTCLFSHQGITWTRRGWNRVFTATRGTTSPMCFLNTCPCEPDMAGWLWLPDVVFGGSSSAERSGQNSSCCRENQTQVFWKEGILCFKEEKGEVYF